MKAMLATALVIGIALPSAASTVNNRLEPEPASAEAVAALINPGNIIAVREITLKPGIDAQEFERFVAEEFTPTFEEHVPGVRSFILKGTRGDRRGGYAFVLVFDSENTRNFYFPREHGGEASVQGAALELWRPGQQMILDRLLTYVDGISETEGYTDYLVLG